MEKPSKKPPALKNVINLRTDKAEKQSGQQNQAAADQPGDVTLAKGGRENAAREYLS